MQPSEYNEHRPGRMERRQGQTVGLGGGKGKPYVKGCLGPPWGSGSYDLVLPMQGCGFHPWSGTKISYATWWGPPPPKKRIKGCLMPRAALEY